MSVPIFIFKFLGAITTMYYLFVIVCSVLFTHFLNIQRWNWKED